MLASVRNYAKGLYANVRASRLLASIGDHWNSIDNANNLRRRQYESFEIYLEHQALVEQMGVLPVVDADQLYALRKRLLRAPYFDKQHKVMCVGANASAVVSVFNNLGAIAVVADADPRTDDSATGTPISTSMSSFPGQVVDIIYVLGIDSLYDIEELLAQSKRCLTPKGMLLIEGRLDREFNDSDKSFRSFEWSSLEMLVAFIERAGFELVSRTAMNVPKDGVSLAFELSAKEELIARNASLLFEVEEPFATNYKDGLNVTGTVDSGEKRRARFYNVIQLLRQTRAVPGAIVECGCWRGLSSYLICQELKLESSNFDGDGFYVLDSFEGLSEPLEEDVIALDLVAAERERKGAAFKQRGAYAADLDHVKKVLDGFPRITYVKGWIPESLSRLEEQKYRFVHIDVDLYEPTLGAIAYFVPRMQSGGIIVCDDYGSLFWPGAKKAVDEFAASNGLIPLSLSSGQAVLLVS